MDKLIELVIVVLFFYSLYLLTVLYKSQRELRLSLKTKKSFQTSKATRNKDTTKISLHNKSLKIDLNEAASGKTNSIDSFLYDFISDIERNPFVSSQSQELSQKVYQALRNNPKQSC